MSIQPYDLESPVTFEGYCSDCLGDLKYIGDLGPVSVFWCVECGTEHSVTFGTER